MAIRVFIVDDSAVVRQVLGGILAEEPDIEVLGAAADPLFAWDRMAKAWPDVLILDVEMPRMDGLTFLHKLMATRPLPVIICSSLTQAGARTTLEALAAGAVGVVAKPQIGLKNFLTESAADLVGAVRAAAVARVARLAPAVAPGRPGPVESGRLAPAGARPAPEAMRPVPDATRPALADRSLFAKRPELIAIGTSTGGTQALEVVLRPLPAQSPPLAIVQHMPAGFTAPFAERLDKLCAIAVREAQDGDRLQSGLALIAPGGRHMQVKRDRAGLFVEVRDGPPVNRHRPSVDVLFRSVASAVGKRAGGVILTGMGSDGARGLLDMHRAGAVTVAQDERTCVVFGMPKEAIRCGAVDRTLALETIAAELAAVRPW